MKRYLLDTNVISELRRPKPHEAVVTWLKTLREEQIFLSAITLGELQAGIERIRPRDPKKANEIEAWVDQMTDSIQILPMDVACFREWGRLIYKRWDQLLEDAMIAATARVHGLIVATRNIRDFGTLGVIVANPFDSE